MKRGLLGYARWAEHRPPPAHAAELGRVWRRLAGRAYPAMAVIGVVRLWDEQALVELDGIAVLPHPKP